MLIPTVRRTWAPRGCTPIIRHRYSHARISVIAGLTLSPSKWRLGLYFQPYVGNISRDQVEQFLGALLRHLRGHVIVVWDGASVHHPKGLREMLARYARLHLEKLPAYAPQLNPIEALWHAAKLPLANGQPNDIPELGRDVVGSLRAIRASQPVLRGCISQSDLGIRLR
jgi:transposase